MEHDRWPGNGTAPPAPADVGLDHQRGVGDEPPPAGLDAAPDPLAPIAPRSTVSGHVPAPEAASPVHRSPEHDWEAARPRIFPLLRPAGTPGVAVEGLDPVRLAAEGLKTHAEPLVDEGPGGLAVVYGLAAPGFDVIVNADHLLSWGVTPADVQDAALENLAAWSSAAAWSDEHSDQRRLLSSQTGDGGDAARILLPGVLDHLASELGGDGRVLVGLPERHLLIAGTLRSDDEEFAALLAEFVVEQSAAADEPIERHLFELVDGRVVPFAG